MSGRRGAHWSPRDLRSLGETGTLEASRRETLEACFLATCPACWRAIRELGATRERLARVFRIDADGQPNDMVTRAMGRVLVLHGPEKDREARRIRKAHRQAAEGAKEDRLSWLRLVIEESWHLLLRTSPRRARDWVDPVAELLHSVAPSKRAPGPWAELRRLVRASQCLASIYGGDLAGAVRFVDKRSIVATDAQIRCMRTRAYLAVARGQRAEAEKLLASANRILQTRGEDPELHAEVLAEHATLLGSLEPRRTLKLLEQALELSPDDGYRALRLGIVYQLTRVLLGLGRFEQARSVLGDHGLLKAHDPWQPIDPPSSKAAREAYVLGLLFLEGARFEQAARWLDLSFGLHLELRRHPRETAECLHLSSALALFVSDLAGLGKKIEQLEPWPEAHKEFLVQAKESIVDPALDRAGRRLELQGTLRLQDLVMAQLRSGDSPGRQGL